MFANKQFHESMDEFQKLGTDPYNVIRLFPDLLPEQNDTETPNPVPKLEDRDLENGLSALIEYLTVVRLKTHVDTQTKATSNASGNLNERTSTSKATSQLIQIIDTTLLKCYLQVIFMISYKNMFCNFFFNTKKNIKNYTNSGYLKNIITTVLTKYKIICS